MKIVGVDYEDGERIGIDVLCGDGQRIHFIRVADAVDIVRCKECKFAHMTSSGECKYCDIISETEKLYYDGNHFCSDGERKDDA